MTDGPSLHPELQPLAALLGTWRGKGHGDYPSIEAFDYLEELTFGHVGKPFLAYSQKTRNADTDMALHAEAGYLRPGVDGVAEWVIAQPTGIVEVLTGRQTPGAIDFTSTDIVLTPSALEVTEVRRLMEFDGDELNYELHMAATGHPMQLHLKASLHRVT